MRVGLPGEVLMAASLTASLLPTVPYQRVSAAVIETQTPAPFEHPLALASPLGSIALSAEVSPSIAPLPEETISLSDSAPQEYLGPADPLPPKEAAALDKYAATSIIPLLGKVTLVEAGPGVNMGGQFVFKATPDCASQVSVSFIPANKANVLVGFTGQLVAFESVEALANPDLTMHTDPSKEYGYDYLLNDKKAILRAIAYIKNTSSTVCKNIRSTVLRKKNLPEKRQRNLAAQL